VRSKIERASLKEFVLAIKPFINCDIQTRVEGSTFSIYCRDTELFQDLCKKLNKWTQNIYEPASEQELDIMTNNAKQVLCNQFPHRRYHYKLYLKSDTALSTRESFSSWIKNYSEKVRATKDTERWFKGRYTQGPYVYVDDQKMLSLASMFLGANVKKIEEYILRDDINQIKLS
jgi:hypothetical protein